MDVRVIEAAQSVRKANLEKLFFHFLENGVCVFLIVESVSLKRLAFRHFAGFGSCRGGRAA